MAVSDSFPSCLGSGLAVTGTPAVPFACRKQHKGWCGMRTYTKPRSEPASTPVSWDESGTAFCHTESCVGQSKGSPAPTQGTGKTGEAGAHKAQSSVPTSLAFSCLWSRRFLTQEGNLHLIFLDGFFS